MNLNLFLNPIMPENAEYPASRRFVDENGEPLMWKIRRLSAGENRKIRRSCTRLEAVPDNPGVMVPVLMLRDYARRMAVACTVYPDLKDAALQDFYHVMGEEDLLRTMLTAGEYLAYLNKVQDVNRSEKSTVELQVQAKN